MTTARNIGRTIAVPALALFVTASGCQSGDGGHRPVADNTTPIAYGEWSPPARTQPGGTAPRRLIYASGAQSGHVLTWPDKENVPGQQKNIEKLIPDGMLAPGPDIYRIVLFHPFLKLDAAAYLGQDGQWRNAKTEGGKISSVITARNDIIVVFFSPARALPGGLKIDPTSPKAITNDGLDKIAEWTKK